MSGELTGAFLLFMGQALVCGRLDALREAVGEVRERVARSVVHREVRVAFQNVGHVVLDYFMLN